MKKILSIILSLTLLLSMSVTVFAEATSEGTQTVSVEVPTPCYDYTVTIPASCSIEYGNTERQSIGAVTVTSDYWDNIYADYNSVMVEVAHSNYLTNADGDRIFVGVLRETTEGMWHPNDGETQPMRIEFRQGNSSKNLAVQIPNWSSAKAGETYSLTLTYTSFLLK